MINKITQDKDLLTELIMNLVEQGHTHFIPMPAAWNFEED